MLRGIFGDKPLAVGALDEGTVGEFAPVGYGDHAGGVAADAEDGVIAHESASARILGAHGEDAGAVALAEVDEVLFV